VPQPRRNPFEGVTDYVSELTRMRALGTHGADPSGTPAERTHASAWVPAADILAHGDDLLVRIELPGVHPDDVDLLLSHGVLTVSGSRAAADGADEDDFYVRERYWGAFRRVITLPEGTEPEQLSAEFADGLVEITVRGGVRAPEGSRIAMADRSRGATRRGVVSE